MSTKFKTWVSAARLRTLPLSVAGIITGTALAILYGFFAWDIFILAICTTLGLQILSNFANDYGDGIKGTDNEERIGPMRALQSGIITDKEMKKAMVITSVITMGFALSLIYTAFGKEDFLFSVVFFILGLASIGAAIKYTVGKSAYGYRGLGDVFVFLFFGLLSVVGSFFLYHHYISFSVFLPAISVGLLSTAVLNLNNMRDRLSDAKSGKNTLVVKMGGEKAKKYHSALILIAFFTAVEFIFYTEKYILAISLIAFIPLFVHLQIVARNKVPQQLDPELKKVALSTFLFSILFLVGAVI
ncbi:MULTISPECIES: 1,4-dihydroxy-2-naphthoate octaprenyltransferase [Mesonia]|uniref:1,4-dihydroxy-2-naphthoate octaprenyltransferase n=1 Tax=Mesonia oceanica TaxID=2687242 RepID=A0AC61Y6V7_9FLAO|nr:MULTISPECIES: 1,4-dihydroxy-2-naphthoate octaprenyltransferase [Mesonia]MAN26082.1 1,4-dihydroxy-2-naphthoate octaprenyltransferase [Mesonia sp.]MAQ42215.1 1,4-dihydroxy-2-naphthoate octaprenyltransferase [Mesonia sp.]MBJ97917.1 1,4-dihydroxy-2-naphthoate octaprenyltransferase [Flavobacteriaceae bacterium]VVV00084.1 1,4-dihydroxy-2-naphthoate octaprenyltransferase [Mesonia oceanica]|tara:strand:+ start:30842 stop:31744 length:903 start_codon:yes stop_codon:yes gene_type:complete